MNSLKEKLCTLMTTARALSLKTYLRLKKWTASKDKKFWLSIIAVIVFSLLFSMLFVICMTKPKPSNKSNPLAQLITQQQTANAQLQQQLENVQKNLNANDKKAANQKLQQAMQAVQTKLQQLETTLSKQTQASQAQDANTPLSQIMQRIDAELKALQKQNTPKHYLSVSQLPFKVTGMDNWNGIPMLTIKLNNQYTLMRQGDRREGFILASLNPQTKTALLENKKQQWVKVVL